ncbi:zinc finger SWIM domain-containing protein 8 homolog [Chironomus tepperi]|uniref:zinc finger SWIM domain-containing protein 8 homolog n=1 Tax=Chironomus tepperi TaxID=113505 RepID=UPI00391F58AB
MNNDQPPNNQINQDGGVWNNEQENDRLSFEDSDRFSEGSLCSWSSEQESLCNNWRGWKKPNLNITNSFGISLPRRNPDDVISLTELAARCVASYIPFELVEHVFPPVPEQLQLRIAFWSFPDNEEDIRLYSCLANSSADEFHRGEQLFKNKCVKDPLQIGFHLSATVILQQPKNQYNVAVTFDRRRISSCNCTCTSSAYWCSHVVAVCLFRIHCPTKVSLRAPVSESLTRLQRDQLQKFAQYLISELPQQILPTAQRLLDELLSAQPTTINTVCGAPDPTAGASINDQTNWYLDEKTLHDNIAKILIKFCMPTPMVFSDVNYLTNSAPPAAAEWSSLLRPLRGREPEGMWNLLSIVREMYRRCDRNAIRLLEIITDECMAVDQILVWWFNIKLTLLIGYGSHSGGKHNNAHNNSNSMQHACASLCDEIVVLWRLAALNPGLAPDERDLLHAQFTTWHLKILDRVTKCTVASSSHNSRQQQNMRNDTELFTGFKPAIEACYLDWEDYPIPGVTHTQDTNPMYHCPFACFKSESKNDGVSNGITVHSSQAILQNNVKQFHSQAHHHHHHHHHHPHMSNQPGPSTTGQKNNRHRSYASSSQNSQSSSDSVNNIDLNPVNLSANDSKRNEDFGGNRSSVSSEGFCENEDEIDDTQNSSKLSTSRKSQNADESLDNSSLLDDSMTLQNDPTINEYVKNEKENVNNGNDLTSPSSSNSLSSTSSLSILSQKQQQQQQQQQHMMSKTNNNGNNEYQEPTPSTNYENVNLRRENSRRSSKDDSTSSDSQMNEDYTSMSNVEQTNNSNNHVNVTNNVHSNNHKEIEYHNEIREQSHNEGAAMPSNAEYFQKQIQNVFAAQLQTPSQPPTQEKMQMFSNLKPTEDAWDILFARAEGLHAHGHGREACILAVRLAEQMLAHPPNLMIEVPPPPKRKGKKHINPLSHQVSVLASATLSKCAFLCTVLAENSEHYHIAFRVCLFGLEMPRPPASTKPLEVKLANQESDLLALLKKIPLNAMELKIIRDRAEALRDGTLKSRGEALLPIMLASFIFEALVMPSVTGKENRMKALCASYRYPTDENLGFEAAVAALGLKANVSEAEHPLLCEGTRRQRGDLALTLLSYYRDEPRKICRIMEKLLDREIHSLIKTPLLPSYYSNNPPTRSQSSQMRLDAEVEQQYAGNELLNEFNGNSRPQSSTSAELENGMSAMSLNPIPGTSAIQPAASSTPPQIMSNNITGTISRTKDLRYKGKRAYPSIPNQPSEASAHFMFELAKNVLTKGGGTSSTSLFTQANATNNSHDPHRALHMCAFQIGLYALGLHNCVSPNWLSRTYSSHVSWIMGQAMEIGAPAISFLIDTWEGHLTPPEAAAMADRASSRGWDGNMVYPAAELALSVLPHAAALNPNEIQRAILQCKEQSDQMLERACITVEKAAKGGGVYPEVLFQVAKYWYELYLRNTPGGELEPEEQHDYFNVNLMSLVESSNELQQQQPAAPPPGPQANPQQPYPPPQIPLPQMGMPTYPYAPYPCQQMYPNIPYHAPNQMQMYISPSQFSYPPPPPHANNPAAPYGQPQIPPQFQMAHQPPSQSYQPMPNPPQQFPQMPVQVNVPPGANPTAGPAPMQYFGNPPPPVAMQQPGGPNMVRPPQMIVYPPSAASGSSINVRHRHQFSPTQLRYLLQAYNVGMLALETLARRVHDDRPQQKYARNPPYGDDVKWLLRISKRLGTQYLHQFCVCAVNSIVSPFILHEVAIESAHYLARSNSNNSALVMQHLRSTLLPLVQKCQQMYIQCIHTKLYHLTVADYEEFTNTILSARAAFQITPEGHNQFKDWIQSIRRSKSCKKELWTQINAAMQNQTK